ncbi:MAG: tetratricopeptide repeat protein [Gallionella sp.]|nr:tetratricopeptide repeat protein [Gallionella sp.]
MNVKPGRNDPCPCGSGKKFKKCCAAQVEAQTTVSRTPQPTPTDFNQLATLHHAGRYLELEKQSRLLLKHYPNSAETWKALAIALLAQGKDVIPVLQQATEFVPQDVHAHINLGNALHHAGRVAEAVASFSRALKIQPKLTDVHILLGNALRVLGQLESAVASYQAALKLNPNYAEVYSNLGNVLQELGLLDAAMASYRSAIKLKPDYAEAHSNLGNVLYGLGKFQDSADSCRRALALKPDFAEAHGNLGNALSALGQLQAATESYRRAVAIQPDAAKAQSDLGNALHDLGQFDEAVTHYRRALTLAPAFTDAHSNLLFTLNYAINQPMTNLRAEAQRYGECVTRQVRALRPSVATPKSCLRVGLVSGDLNSHPVGYFIASILSALKTQAAGRLEIFAYPTHPRCDSLTEQIKSHCHVWHPAYGLSDARLVQRIQDDGIDILIDLAGHTAHNRLPVFAWQPAPVQASWLGYFATTGVAQMDYLIADPWVVPEAEANHFTETVWRLPETYLCFTPPNVDIEVAPLPALIHGDLTFGCFNNLAKMNDAVVALWSRILHALPHARLFLKTKQLNDAQTCATTLQRFEAHGIAADRLILEGSSPRAELLAAYQRVDMALDPFPYPGGTTSVEAVWMGVPVLTKRGDHFLAHVGETIAHNAGLSAWVAQDEADYVAKAIAFAVDLDALAALRGRLRPQVMASPLFDAPRFAQHFEAALWGMWHDKLGAAA